MEIIMVEFSFKDKKEFFIDYGMNQQLLDFYQLLSIDTAKMFKKMVEDKHQPRKYLQPDFRDDCVLHFKKTDLLHVIYRTAKECFYNGCSIDSNIYFYLPKTYRVINDDKFNIRVNEDKIYPRVMLTYSKPDEFKKYEINSVWLGYNSIKFGLCQTHEYKSTTTPEQ
jgi:hypothetical protein